jgi:hypothetical protein
VSTPLTELVDCRAIMREVGVSRRTAEAMMRNCPVVTIDGLRRVFVQREDVQRYLESRTSAGEWVFRKSGAGPP